MTNPYKVLVTGATGFIGHALTTQLINAPSCAVVTASRSLYPIIPDIEHRQHDLLSPKIMPAMDDVDVVIHTAARVHVMNDTSNDKLRDFRIANVVGTVALANAASQAGVKRFIYLSSIKVNGEKTLPGLAFTAFDPANPEDPYGVSKHEAEVALREIQIRTGMEVVVVRPPLVYGPGVKANFRKMMGWLNTSLPLPLGAVNNSRSLVAVANLVDLLVCCMTHPAAAGQTFLVSDGEDLSTTQLMQRVAAALGRKSWLVPLPSALLSAVAYLLGKGEAVQRLCGSLQVDITHTRALLNWQPPVTVSAALQETTDAFLIEQTSNQ